MTPDDVLRRDGRDPLAGVRHPAGGFRKAFCLTAVALMVLIGAPLQWVALRLAPGAARRLPMIFHRAVCAVIGLRVVVRGDLPAMRPLLLVSNHVSWLDIMVLGSLFPVSFVSKAEVENWPVFGTLAKLQRTIFVNRTRRTATATVNHAIATRMAEGDPVVLFAEGTTGDGTRVLPFRSSLLGAATSAIAGADAAFAVPVSIAYARRDGLPLERAARADVAWAGDTELVPHLDVVLRRGPIDCQVSIGLPMRLDAGADRKAAARDLQRAVRRMTSATLTGREPAE
jgi:1-acyl-sn-glycerol-3-phosphate acyltransferase